MLNPDIRKYDKWSNMDKNKLIRRENETYKHITRNQMETKGIYIYGKMNF